jgi:two-component system, NtrC family, response regulator HydG
MRLPYKIKFFVILGIPMKKILIVDDDTDMCLLLGRFLTRHGFEVESAHSGKEALSFLKRNKPALILCDFRLTDLRGTDILIQAKKLYPEIPFIVITGYGDVKEAVEIMKLGAYDYITKPLYPDEILLLINKTLTESPKTIHSRTEKEQMPHSAKLKNAANEKYIFGDTPEFKNILKQIALVAPTNYTIIISGESGSGKEAIAQQVHLQSKRANMPFVAIDCGVLSKELAGSELFGHEKGAFTGAVSQKIGSFELAAGGTVFLDEIANLPYDVQVSLLRFVETRKIRRIGGIKDIEVDLRIIVASNEKLWLLARAGKFREDLYHRFNEFSIDVPPLRERRGDILLFARHFLKITNQELGKNIAGFTKEVEEILTGYVWYGNLRELKNVIKRAALLTDGMLIEAKSLPFEINNYNKLQFDSDVRPATEEKQRAHLPEDPSDFGTQLKHAEMTAEATVIFNALKETNYNKSKAAKLLKMDRKTLYNKLKLYQGLSSN